MRVKTGIVRARRHKEVMKAAKGRRLSISRRYKAAQESLLHSGQYAYNSRRLKKRDIRRLWIMRINAGLKTVEGPRYSVFIKLLSDAKVELNRQSLAELAANDINAFKSVVDKVWSK